MAYHHRDAGFLVEVWVTALLKRAADRDRRATLLRQLWRPPAIKPRPGPAGGLAPMLPRAGTTW